MTREEYQHMRHVIKVEHARTESKFSIEREKLKAKRVQLNMQMADVKRQLSDLGRKQAEEIVIYHEKLSDLLKEYEENKEQDVEPISISQMSRAKLVSAMPWREMVHEYEPSATTQP